jgi:hypothetical protein
MAMAATKVEARPAARDVLFAISPNNCELFAPFLLCPIACLRCARRDSHLDTHHFPLLL